MTSRLLLIAFTSVLGFAGCETASCHRCSSVYDACGPMAYPAYGETIIDEPVVKSWSPATNGLVMAWDREYGVNKIISAGGGSAWRFQPRGKAKFDDSGTMQLEGGAVTVDGGNQTLLDACKLSNELSIEIILTAAKKKQTGPARIVTFSSNANSRNFTLGHEGDHLILRLRTPRTGNNGSPPETKLAPVTAGTPQHIVVTYSDGRLLCFVNGKKVLEDAKVRGNFSNWEKHHLLLGDEYDGKRDWAGSIQRLGLYSRALDAAEIQERYEAAVPALNR